MQATGVTGRAMSDAALPLVDVPCVSSPRRAIGGGDSLHCPPLRHSRHFIISTSFRGQFPCSTRSDICDGHRNDEFKLSQARYFHVTLGASEALRAAPPGLCKQPGPPSPGVRRQKWVHHLQPASEKDPGSAYFAFDSVVF